MRRPAVHRSLAVLSSLVLAAGVVATSASSASAVDARYDLDWTLTAQDQTINSAPVDDNLAGGPCPTGPGEYYAKRVRLIFPTPGIYRFRTNTSGTTGRILMRFVDRCVEYDADDLGVRTDGVDDDLVAWLTTSNPRQTGTVGMDVIGPAAVRYVPLFESRVEYTIDENDATQASATGCPVAGDGPGFVLGTLQVGATGDYDVSDLAGTGGRLDGVLTFQRPDGSCTSVDGASRVSLTQGANRVVLSARTAGSTGGFGFLLDGPGTTSLTIDDPAAYCALAPSQVPAPYKALVGTAKADTLTGTAGFDVIYGLGGDDRINGLGGADVLCGGDGGDVLDGGAGNDVLVGGLGADRLVGGIGNDTAYGDAGADRLEGNEGNDLLFGGAGADRLDGGAGFDTGTDPDKGSSFTAVEVVRQAS